MPSYLCSVCGAESSKRRCEAHGGSKRPNFRQRGYNAEFQRNRARLLAKKPKCIAGCGRLATVADHHPMRRQLVAMGVENPDDLIWLRPMCTNCHNKRTANEQSK